jgi:hypothetical protein
MGWMGDMKKFRTDNNNENYSHNNPCGGFTAIAAKALLLQTDVGKTGKDLI